MSQQGKEGVPSNACAEECDGCEVGVPAEV